MHKEIYLHELDRFPYQPISHIWIIIYILLSFYFFIKLNRLFILYNINNKDLNLNWLRRNILLSFIHACICSTLLLISILRAPEMFQDPLSHSNHFNCIVIAFSSGYFLYDFFDHLYNSTSSIISILTHHIIVLIFSTQVLFHARTIGYAIIGLSIEVNSVFLHARRLLRWYPSISISFYNKNLLQLLVDIGNYITFFLFRFGTVMFGFYALYVERNRIPFIVHTFLSIITLAVGILNTVLFYRLIKSQYRRKPKIKEEEQQQQTKDELFDD